MILNDKIKVNYESSGHTRLDTSSCGKKKKNHRISQNVFYGTLLCGIVSVLHVKGIPSVVEFGHILATQYLNPIPVYLGESPHFMSPCWR